MDAPKTKHLLRLRQASPRRQRGGQGVNPEPTYFGKLSPERAQMRDALMELITPHLADLDVGESEGIRLVMVKDGARKRLKVIFEGKRREVLL